MAQRIDGEMGWGNYLRDHVRRNVNAMLEDSPAPLDKDHIERRKEELSKIKVSNQDIIQRFASDNSILHWHTREGMVFGELSEGCPLCVGYKVA